MRKKQLFNNLNSDDVIGEWLYFKDIEEEIYNYSNYFKNALNTINNQSICFIVLKDILKESKKIFKKIKKIKFEDEKNEFKIDNYFRLLDDLKIESINEIETYRIECSKCNTEMILNKNFIEEKKKEGIKKSLKFDFIEAMSINFSNWSYLKINYFQILNDNNLLEEFKYIFRNNFNNICMKLHNFNMSWKTIDNIYWSTMNAFSIN